MILLANSCPGTPNSCPDFEKFWNCADLQIIGKGGGGSVAPTMAPTAAVASPTKAPVSVVTTPVPTIKPTVAPTKAPVSVVTTPVPTIKPTVAPTKATTNCSNSCYANTVYDSWWNKIEDSWCQVNCDQLVSYFPTKCIAGCRTIPASTTTTLKSLRGHAVI